jgi:hypothetical protein
MKLQRGILNMTILLLVSFVILSPMTISISNTGVFAAIPSTERNGIVLASIHTEPSVVHINQNFSIHANLIDYSLLPIEVWRALGCGGPITAKFDNHVATEKPKLFCPTTPTILIKKSSTPLVAGEPSNRFAQHFRATSAGVTNATLYLEYHVIKKSEQTSFNRDNASLISCFHNNKMYSPCSFIFTILP